MNIHKRLWHSMRSILLCLVIFLTSLSCGCGKLGSEDFAEYTQDLFLEEVSSNTLTMHYTLENPLDYGISEYELSIGGCSPDAQKSAVSGLKSIRKKLNRFDRDSLSTEDALTLDVLSDYVDSELSLADYPLYEEPLLPSGGMASQLPLLFAQFPLHDAQDISDYLNLLGLVDDYFDEVLEFEEEKADAGLFMSDELCQKTLAQLEDFITEPEEHYLTKSFENRLAALDMSEDTRELYLNENTRILRDSLLPAYRRLITGLTRLMGSGRNDLGLCKLENGKDYYEALVRSYTGSADSIEKLEQRIEEARANDFAVCANLIASDPDVLEKSISYDWNFSEDQEMIDALTKAMKEDFPLPPEVDCRVEYVDPSMQQYLAPAFYITAPIDDYFENTIYINSASDYQDIHYFTTLAHEGLPGHLYQTVMSYTYGQSPVRSLLGYPGYTEGWATYVELLSYGYAGLPENVAELLSHNQAATISLYAASDIGIHYEGWDADQMYTFWSDYGVTDKKTIDEIMEIILADPGNYLKYYIGYLNILDLRQKMMDAYGDDFSLKAFHEALLRIGPASFPVIGEYIDYYYSSALQ